MHRFAWLSVLFWWVAWFYPFIFHAPHFQKRPSITVPGPTRVGLFLELAAIFLAFLLQNRPGDAPGIAQFVAAYLLGGLGVLLFWTSITHLGKQFRIHAGLYHDHELVRTGPYAIVRHPIYCSILCMLVCTMLLVTRLEWAAVPMALFIVGTEIRVHSEDKLLASRFGAQFESYRKQVRAYIPFVR
jgi:protein-S-isoprenylcysteine O-methyltransferase Ste14